MASPGSVTRPEELSAQYADRWVWTAEPRHPADGAGKKITADDIDSLAGQLAAAAR